MLSSVKDLESAGIYSIAFFIGVFVEIPRRAISQISRPVIAEAFHNNKLEVIRDIYHKSALNQMLLGSIIYIAIVGSIDSLFSIMPNGEIYAIGSNVVLIIGAVKLFDMSMGGNSEVIGNSPFYRFNFMSLMVMAPLGIITNLWLIPIMGITGAAWASLITLSVVNIFRFSVVYFKTGMIPFTNNWLKGFFLLILFLVIARVLPDLKNPYFSLIYKSALLIIGFISSILILKLSTDLNGLFSKYFKR
jgi:O-antigen/teichoic acid export membrane protein